MTESPFGSGPRQAAPAGGPAPRVPDPEHEQEPGVVFRDKRRIDPETFQPRPGAQAAASQPATAAGADSAAEAGPDGGNAPSVAESQRVEELTADLQRLSAEYANYRKRVDRDREVQRELTTAALMNEILPVLDDIGRAREHGELEGGFKAVAESVEAYASKHGLVAYGEVGEAFDPNIHEAMTSTSAPDVTEPTVTAIYQVGYRVEDRVIRPARVGVTDAE